MKSTLCSMACWVLRDPSHRHLWVHLLLSQPSTPLSRFSHFPNISWFLECANSSLASVPLHMQLPLRNSLLPAFFAWLTDSSSKLKVSIVFGSLRVRTGAHETLPLSPPLSSFLVIISLLVCLFFQTLQAGKAVSQNTDSKPDCLALNPALPLYS